MKNGTITLYETGKKQRGKRGGGGGNGKSSSSDDESEESGGYGEDGKWEVKDLLDRRSKKTRGGKIVYEYLVLWVTNGDEADTSWEPRSSLYEQVMGKVKEYDARFPFRKKA